MASELVAKSLALSKLPAPKIRNQAIHRVYAQVSLATWNSHIFLSPSAMPYGLIRTSSSLYPMNANQSAEEQP